MVKEEGKFKWLEEGKGEQPIILLHGLMGGVENFGEMVDFISNQILYIITQMGFTHIILNQSLKTI